MNKHLNKKKALSPIIASALLLVVFVIAVMSFQKWFYVYTTDVFSDVQTQQNNEMNNNVQIVNMIGDQLSIVNNIKDNLQIKTLKINNDNCTINTNLSLGSNLIDISDCLENVSTISLDIVLITDKTFTEKSLYYKKVVVPLNCSILDGGEWIYVEGNPTLGTQDFCVMKYEAKDYGGVATSQSSGNPWVNTINQSDAREECEKLGDGYRLITDAQWVTIARIAEADSTNWANGVVGSTVASGGGLYRGNVNKNDSVGCGNGTLLDGDTPGQNCMNGSRNKRTLNISGELIWDLSGNVWEVTDDTFSTTGTENSSLGKSSTGWYEWNTITGYDYLGPVGSYDINYGIGRARPDVDTALPDGSNTHAFWRGGNYAIMFSAGVFTLTLENSPKANSGSLGFRCAYTN